MADQERFDIRKWVGGFIDPKTWSKSVVYGLMIVFLLFIGVTIYRAYFMKTQQQKTSIGNVQSGGVVNITNVQEKKRPWWMPIPYISVSGVAQNDARGKFDDMKYGYKGELGVRIDF